MQSLTSARNRPKPMARTRKVDDQEGSEQGLAPTAPSQGDAEANVFARLIERLPEERRLAVLLGFFTQLDLPGLISQGLSRPQDIETMFWLEALARHRLGEPERLAALLRKGSAPPPMVGDYLASIVELHAPRPRGRPKQVSHRSESLHQALSDLIERRQAYHQFRARYDQLRNELSGTPGGTPSEHALVALAAERSISVAEARRRLREGKRWVDPPPRSNAAERDQDDPKWLHFICAHCHRATSMSVSLIEVLLKIS